MKLFTRRNSLPPRLISLLIIAVLIGVDRLTKWLIMTNIEHRSSVSLIKIGGVNVLNFTHVHNTGAAFSILQGQRLFLILTVGLILTGILVFLMSDRLKSKLFIAALTLLAGGGMGNLIDRVFYGYVIDFIDFQIINFAIFNFADICAVTGTFMAMFAAFREEIMNGKNKERSKELSENETNDENE